MGLDSQKHVTSENQGYIYRLRQNFAGSRHRASPNNFGPSFEQLSLSWTRKKKLEGLKENIF